MSKASDREPLPTNTSAEVFEIALGLGEYDGPQVSSLVARLPASDNEDSALLIDAGLNWLHDVSLCWHCGAPAVATDALDAFLLTCTAHLQAAAAPSA